MQKTVFSRCLTRALRDRAVAAAVVVFALTLQPVTAAGYREIVLPVGPQHVYVSEPTQHAVFGFQLSTAGIPASTPDVILTGLGAPSGLAIGPDGSLYVVDVTARQLDVYAPAPVSGSAPSRVLSLPYRQGLGAVGVDASANVYIGYNTRCGEGSPCADADVYAAGASKPFASYFLGGSPPRAFVGALQINAQRDLAVVAARQPFIYANAPNKPAETPYELFCPALIGWGAAWGTANELFLTGNGALHTPKQPSAVIVIPDFTHGPFPNCPSSYGIAPSTIPLEKPLGIASSHGYVYVTSAYNTRLQSALVFVLDPTKPGAQKPVAVVGGAASELKAPYALAIGP